MDESNFTPWSALLGGSVIGLSAAVLLVFHGRIAGISGILGGLVQPTHGDVGWRGAFLLGLGVGGLVILGLQPDALEPPTRSLALLAVAGLLVGMGTRIGNGCTSGHGICGVSRGSRRSLVATATFLATGALAATATRLVEGGL